MKDSTWLERIDRRIRRWIEAGLGRSWVIAVSGGSDSVALLRVLHGLAPTFELELAVAHLDHGARGEAGRGDAAFVAGLAGSLGLPFELGHWAPTRPAHFEADARRARLDFLHDVAQARGATAVALGHTRDDQAETVLHRILRGTGPRGLGGIPVRRPLGPRVTLMRPLLDVRRATLRAYLADLGQPFRDDATNADTSRTRARIRHELLPQLEQAFNPHVADALARLANLSRASYRALRQHARLVTRRARRYRLANVIALDQQVLQRVPQAVRAEAIRVVWQRSGWPEADMSADRWQRLAALVTSYVPTTLDVGAGVVAEVTGTTLKLRRTSPPSSPAVPDPRPLALPGTADWPGGRVIATLDPEAPRDETVDLDQLVPPLCVRAPAAGDRFDPLGMEGRTQPLSDFFRGRRVRRAERGHVPLVCDARGIVWVVGQRIAQRVRLTPTTVRSAGLKWEAEPR